jgi:hypothetical protein
MEFFIFNEDSPEAASLARKMADAKPGSLIGCTADEIREWRGPAFNKVSIDNTPSPTELSEVNGRLFASMCNFVMAHAKDIEDNVNDFGTLKPILESMSSNCNGVD